MHPAHLQPPKRITVQTNSGQFMAEAIPAIAEGWGAKNSLEGSLAVVPRANFVKLKGPYPCARPSHLLNQSIAGLGPITDLGPRSVCLMSVVGRSAQTWRSQIPSPGPFSTGSAHEAIRACRNCANWLP
jgi:hypothetical protein